MTNEIKTAAERKAEFEADGSSFYSLEQFKDIEIAELRAKVESLAADEDRYNAFISAGLPICFMGNDYHTKADLDAAIDAYREKNKQDMP